VRQTPWAAIGMSRASWYRADKPEAKPFKRNTRREEARLGKTSVRTEQRLERVRKAMDAAESDPERHAALEWLFFHTAPGHAEQQLLDIIEASKLKRDHPPLMIAGPGITEAPRSIASTLATRH
jgi:hypothetical protein